MHICPRKHVEENNVSFALNYKNLFSVINDYVVLHEYQCPDCF